MRRLSLDWSALASALVNVVSSTRTLGLCDVDRAMQRDDGLAGAGGAGDARRTLKVPLNKLALGGVKEDGPLFPGVIEGAGKFVEIAHDTEAAQSVGMLEWIGCANRLRFGFGTCGEVEQSFCSFGGKVIGD